MSPKPLLFQFNPLFSTEPYLAGIMAGIIVLWETNCRRGSYLFLLRVLSKRSVSWWKLPFYTYATLHIKVFQLMAHMKVRSVMFHREHMGLGQTESVWPLFLTMLGPSIFTHCVCTMIYLEKSIWSDPLFDLWPGFMTTILLDIVGLCLFQTHTCLVAYVLMVVWVYSEVLEVEKYLVTQVWILTCCIVLICSKIYKYSKTCQNDHLSIKTIFFSPLEGILKAVIWPV